MMRKCFVYVSAKKTAGALGVAGVYRMKRIK